AHTERFKNSSLTIGGNFYDFGLNDALVKQNTDWVQDPKQYQSTVSYKLKTPGGGMFKFFTDYSDTRLSFNINNPNTVSQDLLVNNNRNIYMNANFQGFISPMWKIFAGMAYNHTLENGNINADLYDQRDDLLQEKVTLSRSFYGNSLLTFGAEQFQGKHREEYADLRGQYTDVLSAGYAEAEIYFNSRLLLKLGLRAEYSSYIKEPTLAPRSSLSYTFNKKNQLTFSGGTYYQKPDDSFLSRTTGLNDEKANNYALDYEFTAHSRSLRLEGYYKLYRNLAKIVTPVYSGFQAYGPPVYIDSYNNNGSGYARGADVFWRDQRTFPGGEYYVSYSYADTKRNYIDFPVEARPPFVPEHTFNMVGRKFLSKYNTQVSVTYTYSSGRTYFNPLNPVFLGNKTQNNQDLSFGLSYLPAWVKQFVVVNFTVSNILGFNQVYGYRYSYDGSRRETVLPPGKRGFLLSFLMNIGDGTFHH
ncbi:MAG TPA: TonB-dependent receptor, partial [Pedobacter sp.]